MFEHMCELSTTIGNDRVEGYVPEYRDSQRNCRAFKTEYLVHDHTDLYAIHQIVIVILNQRLPNRTPQFYISLSANHF